MKLRDFRPISRCISETSRDTAVVAIDYLLRLRPPRVVDTMGHTSTPIFSADGRLFSICPAHTNALQVLAYIVSILVFTAQCTLVQRRGLGIACRLSVRPSVTLVICDHIGWKFLKPIARTISPTPSLFVAKRRSTYSQRNMGKFWRD